MPLSVRGFTLAAGALWGAALLLVELVHLAVPGYGAAFLQGLSSVYLGLQTEPTWGNVVLGTIYGCLDGAIAGFLFALLYNRFAAR